MGFSKQKYGSGFPFPSPVDHILSELSTTTHSSWWPCTAWLIVSLSYTRLWTIYIFLLAFYCCGFHKTLIICWWVRLCSPPCWISDQGNPVLEFIGSMVGLLANSQKDLCQHMPPGLLLPVPRPCGRQLPNQPCGRHTNIGTSGWLFYAVTIPLPWGPGVHRILGGLPRDLFKKILEIKREHVIQRWA